MKAHEEAAGSRMITLRIHAKAESRQCGPLFIMFSGLGRMFHQHEKYDSDFTDTLSGFSAGRKESVCNERGRRERAQEREQEMREEREMW